MLFALLFIFIFCNLADAATYSIAYFRGDSNQMDFTVKVDGVNALVVPNAVSFQYYDFEYEVGQSLELESLPNLNQLGHYLIRNGPDGTGKIIYDSQANTFFIINYCPEDQPQCRVLIAGANIGAASINIYVNDSLVIENFPTYTDNVFNVKPNDVIKVVVDGTVSVVSSMRFNFLNIIDDNITYGPPVYWASENLVTSAVIETVGITSPKDGAVIYATPAGRSIDIKLSSTPLPALYNVEVGCPSFPPFSQLILSNTAAVQSIKIPPEYDSRDCLVKVIDTISGVNSVVVVITLSRVEIDQFLWSLGLGTHI